MPEFAWRAAAVSGQIVEGQLNAASPAMVLKHLRQQGLTPLRIEAAAQRVGGEGATQPFGSDANRAFLPGRTTRGGARGRVQPADVFALTAELSIMLRAGLALDNALRVLIDMSHKASVGALLANILDSVKGGTPLSRALAKHRDLFGDFYINMVRSGEASGQISVVLERLVEHMARQRALRDSVISATIYPAILLGVAVLSLIAMLGFVVPQFEKLFTDMGDALPLPTRLVMAMGHGFTRYGIVILVVLVLVGMLVRRWLRSSNGRTWLQSRLLNLPLIGRLALRYQLTLFSRSLGTLLGSGVPMLTALHIATETVGNVVLRQALGRVAPIVKDGGRMAQAMAATHIFEPLAVNLIRVGEETGRIGPMMLELANILNRDVEIGIKRMLTLVEPVLILVLGVMIAAIIVSILLGILSINDLAV
ncbi:type II secretion system F family protein [Ramlibacter sp. H39-3-26]|uniref:type II secretion system F family protein n=1 Tax=Curvibacter soli TaxID=3031331 RepID=UPI0023DA18E6|nr:type II secretion system F family protein [Ramlibacter sp. H39-3-26]MDF1486411.1 type II secretion system F family protein [Ramlibacter sp. H39-3-26]